MAAPADLLAQLRDIRLPAPPPQAPVWDLLLAGLCVVLAASLVTWTLWRRRPAWQRDALRALENVDLKNHEQARAELAGITRRVALKLNPDAQSHATGDAYLQQLDKLFATDFFTRGEGQMLGDALYQPMPLHLDPIKLRGGLIGLVRHATARRKRA